MKIKSSKLFSPGLYVESLRQLRLMGLIYLLVCVIFSAIPPLLSGTYDFYPIDPSNHAVVLFVFTFIAPVTLGYVAFGFLTRRNASDFYHSLPVTREATYISRALAVATYLFATIVLSLLVSFVCYEVTGSVVRWGQLPYLISYHLVSALLVLSCTLIGISCAGTYFSSFIVAGVVMFLPRMILLIITALVQYVAPIVYVNALGGVLDTNLNLPVGLIASIFTGGLDSDPLEYTLYLPAHLYTAALALLYFVIGGLLHHGRKSELARASAPNRVLQHVYRCLISLPLFLLLGTFIAADEWGVDFEIFVVLIVCALLVYFIYELITTRKFRNLLPALAVLPIVVAVGLGLPWIGNALGYYELNRCPEREQIASVNLDIADERANNADYTRLQLSNVDYSDEDLLDILHGALENTVEYYNISSGERPNRTGYRNMQVRFNLRGGKTLTRRVSLTPDEYNRLFTLRTQNEQFRATVAALPEYDQLSALRVSGYTVEHWEQCSVDPEQIWKTFREEYAALSPEEQLLLCNYNDRVAYATSVELIAVEYTTAENIYETEFGGAGYYSTGNSPQISGFEGVQSFTCSYGVTSLTPKTLLLVMEYVNDAVNSTSPVSLEALERELGQIGEDSEIYLNVSLRLYDPAGENNGVINAYKDVLSAEQLAAENAEELYADKEYFADRSYLDAYKKMLAILRTGSTEIEDLNSPIVLIDSLGYDVYREGGGTGWYSDSYFVQLTEENFDRLLELMQDYLNS